jgi:hypothetical protein
VSIATDNVFDSIFDFVFDVFGDKLTLNKLVIGAFLLDELVMSALLEHFTFRENHDVIGISDG